MEVTVMKVFFHNFFYPLYNQHNKFVKYIFIYRLIHIYDMIIYKTKYYILNIQVFISLFRRESRLIRETYVINIL